MVSYQDQPAVVWQTTMYSVLGAVLAMPMSTVSPANLHGQYTVAPDSTNQCPHWHHGTVCAIVIIGTGSTATLLVDYHQPL